MHVCMQLRLRKQSTANESTLWPRTMNPCNRDACMDQIPGVSEKITTQSTAVRFISSWQPGFFCRCLNTESCAAVTGCVFATFYRHE